MLRDTVAKLKSSTKKPLSWSPPSWTGWVSLVLSLTGSYLGVRGYVNANQVRAQSEAPRIEVTALQYRHSPLISEVPILVFEVINHGTLSLDDVRTSEEVRSGYTSTSFDFSKRGLRLAPGQKLTRVADTTTLWIDPATKTALSFQDVEGGKLWGIRIRTTATDQRGQPVTACEEFTYNLLARQFDQTGDCSRFKLGQWDTPSEQPATSRTVQQE